MTFEKLPHYLQRLVIRSLRIFCGLLMLLLSLYLVSAGWDKLGTPFAQSNFIELIGGIAQVGLGVGFFLGSWQAAFGQAPRLEKQ